jgi:proteic killer suppression protein
MNKELGEKQAKKLRQRLEELQAAPNMSEIVPAARCHALKGNRVGLFAVDLDQPFRLIFKPDHDPLPLLPDGGLDKTIVECILLLEIRDYH